jgi:hypothetical protein
MRGSSPPLSTRPASASAEQGKRDGLEPNALNAARQAAMCGSSAARARPRARSDASASASHPDDSASLGPFRTSAATITAAS